MLTCATLLFVGDAYWGGHPLLFIWHALFSISLVPVLLACAWAAPSAMAMLANRPMRHLGDISFGVYLWHMPVVLALLPLLPQSWSPVARFWALLGLVLPLSVLIANISYRFIERPFLDRKPKHLS